MKFISYLNEGKIQSERELKNKIDEYGNLTEQIDKIYKILEPQLKELKELEKKAGANFKDISKYMTTYNKRKVTADKWIAKANKELKYKVAKPDYKELWEGAVKEIVKMNKELANMMLHWKKIQLELKEQEVKQVISISKKNEISIMNIIKSIWNKFKSLFSSIDSFGKIVDNLPEI